MFQFGKLERAARAHPRGIPLHHVKARAHVRRKVRLVDDQQVRFRDRGPALAGDLFTRRHVDDVKRDIGELRAEGGRQVVSPAFDQHEVEIGNARGQIGDGGKVGTRSSTYNKS